jgi:hypothetical protein
MWLQLIHFSVFILDYLFLLTFLINFVYNDVFNIFLRFYDSFIKRSINKKYFSY